MRGVSSSCTTWQPVGQPVLERAGDAAGPGFPCRRGGDRSPLRDQKSRSLPDSVERGVPAGSSGHFRCRSKKRDRSPGAPTARRWRYLATTPRFTSGTSRPAPGRRPWRSYEHRKHCRLPPCRHAAGELWLGGRLRLWDPVLGRPWLIVTANFSDSRHEFSPDGRIVLQHEDKLTTYQVDPALEYRTLPMFRASESLINGRRSDTTAGCSAWARTRAW